MASNRSPSPLQSRPSTNPNLRASETNSSIRRSFTGNPFGRPRSFVPNTPANSPAEFGRRLSAGKEGFLRSYEEKENDKVHNLKATKCKSPLKASKNFMSPTISAASKFTPSPRKKILGERNESIRTSISFSDGQESSVSDFDSKSESGFNQNIIEGSSDLAGFHRKEVLKASKRVTFSEEVLPIPHLESSPYNSLYDSETPNKAEKQSDYDCVNLDSSLDLGPFSSPAIAPLDADPSFPPYDPKTNYLSPRPQFLRYRPRQMEIYQSKEGLNFEDNKEFEDNDVTEETDSGDSKEGSTTETLPSEEEEALLLSEPTPVGTPISDQMLTHIFEAKPDSFTISKSEEEELLVSESILTEEEEALLCSEPTPSSTPPISTEMLKQLCEDQKAPKPGFFTRTKFISLILMLLIACASVSFKDVSITSPPAIKDSSFYKLYESSEIASVARKEIDRLAGDFQNWYETSEIAVFAREKLDGLLKDLQQCYDSSDLAINANKYLHSFARELKQYSSQAILYFSKLIPHLGKEDSSISVQFCNITELQEHASKVEYFEANRQKKVAEIHDEYEFEPMVKEEARDDLEEMAHLRSVFSEQDEEESEVQRMIPEEINDSDTAEESEDQSVIDSPAPKAKPEVDAPKVIIATEFVRETEFIFTDRDSESKSEMVLEVVENKPFKDQSVIDSPASIAKSETPTEVVFENKFSATDRDSESKSEVVSEIVENKPFEDQSVIDSLASEAKSEVKAPEAITPTEFVRGTEFSVTDRDSASNSEVVSEVVENKPFVHAMLGISFLVLAVMAASALTFLKKGKNTTAAVNVVKNPEMSGESCPSAMSTFQNSKGSSKKINKAQSQERKSTVNNKRESLASSSEFSTGSPSYGSFTTYERVPIKHHAYGEEEIVTPVRRSSRIRSQITSP
ncbi:uncharacterized protein LOC141682640 [Apium graveolens]|uniref:uncharacterized protein LOC141682640 n=1 Tax=Apium graveolens TaxID=4045 RepID=UPI003D798132